MPNAAMTALVRKREAPKPAPGQEFAPLVTALDKAARQVFADLLQTEVEVKARAAGSRRLASFLAGAVNPGNYYWVFDETGEPAMLVHISGAFAAALTERLLGGGAAPSEGDAPYSTLNFEISGAFVDVATPAFNAAFAKLSPAAGEEALGGKLGQPNPAVVIAEREELEMVSVMFDLEYGGGTVANAAQLYFSRLVLERLGVVASDDDAPASTPPEWSDGLKRNLMIAEIPLTAIAARWSSNIGALSHLEVGQFVEIGDGALEDLELVAETSMGPAVVARGRLGGLRGAKAVKLTSPIDPDFVDGLA